ncbi:MAG TPA: ectonucleotide pyrophosphatase/phosphodiesterase [Terracidiphilus sp.]|jgi:alkaline phosphatase D|nr:ectonucleotide pyrophosphatase/phosphodiesterase [Terracidiphilus sp.]
MRTVAAWRRLLVLLLLAPGLATLAAQRDGFNRALPLTHVDHGANSAWAQQQHYVVLVSLDGFRWDYAVRDHAAHLLALGKAGAWAPEGMLPSYPSLTFPNHYTIVTGLYPGHHGLVANSFYDPARKARYSMQDAKAVADGSWYGGTPLWSLAESRGMRTAVLLWPGSEAEIAGWRPSWYAHFNGRTEASDEAEQARIDDTVALLHEPAAERPHLIAIYYSEPDHEGHEFGPDARQTRAAELKVDALVGRLKAALDGTGLPIDLVVVSDHGMAKPEGGWITLDTFADLKGFETDGLLLYAQSEADRVRVYNQLKKASSDFVAYRLKNVPAGLNCDQNPREGDPVVVATGAYALRAHAPESERGNELDRAPMAGMHGFDPRVVAQMKAIFFAAGPDILEGKTVGPFENVNLYPWLAHLLGMAAPRSDGSLNILAGTLRDGGGEAVDGPEK